MGISPCDSIEAKRYICTTSNRSEGLTAEGETISHGFCETNLEKGMLGACVALPLWSQKGNIWNAGRSFLADPSWSRFGNSCMNGWQRSWNSITHFGNYSNLEFLNGKIAKMESLIAKNSLSFPSIEGADDFITKLANAKNQTAYKRLVRGNNKLYTAICDAVGGEQAFLSRLSNSKQITEIYGQTLTEMKAAKATLDAGGNLQKGTIGRLHQGYANARLAHNTGIRTGSIKAGLRLKGCAQMTKGVKTAMSASKWLRGASRTIGKAGGWVAAGLTIITGVLDCFSAWQTGKSGEKWSCLGKQVLKTAGRAVCELGGAWAGATAGAAIGQACLPFLPGVGALIGGAIGGFVGWFAGSKTADAIPGLEKSVAQEAAEKAADERKQSLCQAIDAMNQADSIQNFDEASIETYVGNLQKVFEYVSTYKAPKVQMDANGQPILDAEGKTQPILDANGNLQYEYTQISADPIEQQAFQSEIDKLHAWVEEKMAGLQEIEQQLQQAAIEEEQARQLAEQERQAELQRYMNMGYGYGVVSPEYMAANSDKISYGSYGNGYSRVSNYQFGDFSSAYANGGGYGNYGNYGNFAYNLDYSNYNNPFLTDYKKDNIFATQYGPQAA